MSYYENAVEVFKKISYINSTDTFIAIEASIEFMKDNGNGDFKKETQKIDPRNTFIYAFLEKNKAKIVDGVVVSGNIFLKQTKKCII